MRVYVTFCLVTTVLVSVFATASVAQRVSLNKTDASLFDVITSISEQTGYNFLMKKELMQDQKVVSIRMDNMPMQEALAKLFAGRPFNFEINDEMKFVIVKEKTITDKIHDVILSAVEGSPKPEVKQDVLRGRVLDSLGNPLAGATVSVKGHGATFTDRDGRFVLRNVPEDATLKISYVGYKDVEVKAKEELTVQMELTTGDLKEVVVNKGYYSTTQKLNTGSIAHVGAEDIGKSPVGNVLAAVEGRMPGVLITQSTGAPGGAFTVQIRGRNSIANGNDPLYIVDGVPQASQTLGSLNSNLMGGNVLNTLNTADIESVDVLKDADATAIYGSRGANGVVLITTKKGKIGATKVDLNLYGGIGKIVRTMDLMNTPEYLQMRREAFKNDGIIPGKDPNDYLSFAPDLTVWDQNHYTDWQKYFYGGTAKYNDAQLSISGGNANIQYLVGGGYHKEGSVFPDDGDETKGSIHFNISGSSPNQKLKIALTGNYLSAVNTLNNSFNNQAVFLPPNAPNLYNEDGTLNWAPLTPGAAGTWVNPLAALQGQIFKGNTDNLTGSSSISYDIFQGLRASVSVGYSKVQSNEVSAYKSSSLDPGYHLTSANAGASFNTTKINSLSVEPQLNYNIRIGKGVLSALTGVSFQQLDRNRQQLNASGFSSDAFVTNPQAATSITVSGFVETHYRYNAVHGRLNYNWEDKYLINLTGRRDGSSRFGPDNQFANFGSVGLGWVFTNESFVKRYLPFLTFGKLRASYGSTGSDQIPDYYFMDLYGNTRYSYDGIKGLNPTRLFNASLAWELTTKKEIGLDLSFLKNSINFGLSYYNNKSGNQLINLQLSPLTGFPGITTNLPGVVKNSGYEFSLNTRNLTTSVFSWMSSFNLTIPKNVLISYPGLSPTSTTFIIGKSLFTRRAYEYIGVNPTTGIYEFNDGESTNTSTPTKQNAFIDNGPKFYGGLSNTIQVKSLTLDFLIQFVKQNGRTFLQDVASPIGANVNVPRSILDNHWQQAGDIASYQMFTQSYSSNATFAVNPYLVNSTSSLIQADASYLRLKNVSLSYQLPSNLSRRISLQGLRVFLQGQNLFTITPYSRAKGFDPETQGLALPLVQVFTLGIHATF